MIAREVRILFWKEWRQLLRSRGVLLTALFLPVLLLLIIPCSQMIIFSMDPSAARTEIPADAPLPPGLATVGDDPRAILRLLLLPLFVALGGLMVPSTTASYTLIAEREARTLELLVALPVKIGQLLLAKLLVIVVLAAAMTFVLFVIDAVLILVLGIGSFGYVVALFLLLIAALAYSTASALLISLLARDFRSANNLNGALIVPTIFVGLGVLSFVGHEIGRVVLLAALFAVAAVVATVVALRVVTFERLLR